MQAQKSLCKLMSFWNLLRLVSIGMLLSGKKNTKNNNYENNHHHHNHNNNNTKRSKKVLAAVVLGSLITSWSSTDTGSKTCDCVVPAGFLQVSLLFCLAVICFFDYSNAAALYVHNRVCETNYVMRTLFLNYLLLSLHYVLLSAFLCFYRHFWYCWNPSTFPAVVQQTGLFLVLRGCRTSDWLIFTCRMVRIYCQIDNLLLLFSSPLLVLTVTFLLLTH